MPTYIGLLNFTEQGIKNIKDGPARLDAAKELYRKAGGQIKGFYLTFGRFDAVVITEAPDDAAAAKLVLTIGQKGNVRTETLRAFTEDEYRTLLKGL